ncbi:carbohydrate kinase [Microtetraspora sp. NBRC 13810]|uniref:xylulokinase n=1 Tax=Microtetraspora sp. NBRC 13810 TaxID=3030990 RepID=UPI0025536D24|nr:FGGY-family carbohydrate kinase [Microtetraspora sp. NBRC 13810]GLW09033.1 carbohydrate kinase [Microtetraspora sp. NBRC 13810]
MTAPRDVPAVLGIDVGSNSARAVALDPDGNVVASAHGTYPGATRWPAGRADPVSWLTGLAGAVTSLGLRPEAICVGGQSPTTVPLDGGLAVTVRHPAGVTGAPDEQHQAQRGVLREENPQVTVRQLYDWLMARLGARNAQSRWPGDPTMDGYGPRAETGEIIGYTDGALGLPKDVALVAGAQDAYLAFWAGGLDSPGRGLDPGGRTGGLAVAMATAGASADLYTLRSPARGVDIVGGPVAGHGLTLEWLAELTGRPVPELLKLAESVPEGADGVTLLPYLEGERAPRWRRELRGEISGLGSGHGPGHLARAALEGAAYGLRHIAASLPVPLDVLVCAGSPALSPLWCQIKADVLEVPVEVPEETGLAAYGAALAAGAGAGWWPLPGDAPGGSWPRPAATLVEPNPRAAYRDGYRRFLDLGDAAESRLGSPMA